MELVNEMQTNKIRGDRVLYEGLANLLSRSNRAEEAVDILNKTSKQFSVTVKTYTAMISVYGKHLGLKAALEKYQELLKRFTPDAHTLVALLSTCARSQDPSMDVIKMVRCSKFFLTFVGKLSSGTASSLII
jgi:hypothetical protein